MKTLILLLAVLISGCSSLILRDTDTGLETTGKVAARVVLVPMTIGSSELLIYHAKQEEACDARGGWYFMGACRAQGAQAQAIYLAPLMMNAMQQATTAARLPYQPMPTLQPMPALPMIQVQPQTNCTSYMIGNQVNTHCY